jgi:hypothetical protein
VTQNVIGWEISHKWEWLPNWDESFTTTIKIDLTPLFDLDNASIVEENIRGISAG